jgi:NitT/TauT family transport system ATP-binding protein
MSLHRNGKEFLDLVEHIESFSRGDHQKASSDGDDRDGSAFEAETTTVFPLDGETL